MKKNLLSLLCSGVVAATSLTVQSALKGTLDLPMTGQSMPLSHVKRHCIPIRLSF